MKTMKYTTAIRSIAGMFVMLFSIGMALAFAPPTGGNWVIPGGTKANFTIDGMLGIDVNGTLTISSASIVFDPANPGTGSMRVNLSVSSLATGIGKRDKHLKSGDYFDMDKYPSISFSSSSIQKSGNGYKVTGKLKMKAVEQNVTIPFTFDDKGSTGMFKGSFTLNRASYGIGTGKENGMGKEVKVRLEIPVRKA